MSEAKSCGTCRWWVPFMDDSFGHCRVRMTDWADDSTACIAHDDGSFDKAVRELVNHLIVRFGPRNMMSPIIREKTEAVEKLLDERKR
jgi:hypothetical protein